VFSYDTEPKHVEVVNWQLLLIWQEWWCESGLFDAAVSQKKCWWVGGLEVS